MKTLSADLRILVSHIGEILALIWEILSPILKTLSADVRILSSISYWRDTGSYLEDTTVSYCEDIFSA